MVRGASLAAALERQGLPAVVLVPSERLPFARRLCSAAIGIARPTSRAELQRRLRSLLERLEVTDLVVDAFPEGILGELAVVSRGVAFGVAIVRQRRDGRSAAFLSALERYQLRLDIEPALEWLPPGAAEPCLPVVRPLARQPSEVDVLLAAGGECPALFGKLSARLAAAGLSVAVRTESDGLLGERELSAPVVVGGAGYNLTHELARLGSWHVALPRARRFDDQRARAGRWAIVCKGPESLERRLLALVRGGGARRPEPTETHAGLACRIIGTATPLASVEDLQ